MPVSTSAFGRASALNCGFVRERGTERTSTSRSTATCPSKATNSAIVRVEWPIVKIVRIVWDCRTDFLPTFASSQSHERKNEDQGNGNQGQAAAMESISVRRFICRPTDNGWRLWKGSAQYSLTDLPLRFTALRIFGNTD